MECSMDAMVAATNKNIQAVVRIQAYVSPYSFTLPHLGTPMGQASGTGFIIGKQEVKPGVERLIIMTAAHVLNTASNFSVRFPSLGAHEIKGEGLVLVPAFDIAVFHIILDRRKDKGLAKLKISVMRLATDKELNTLPQGSAVQAYGFPEALLNVKVTVGSFNGVERHELQHDAATSPGSSGGPVLSKHLNAVIGVVSWKMVGRAVEGVQFTMPVSLWRLAWSRIQNRKDAITLTKSGVRIMKAPMFGFCVQRVTDDLTLAQSCTRGSEEVESELERMELARKAANTVERLLAPFASVDRGLWTELHNSLHRVMEQRKAGAGETKAAPESPKVDGKIKSKSRQRGEEATKVVESGLVARMRKLTEARLAALKASRNAPPTNRISKERAERAAKAIAAARDARKITDGKRQVTMWGGSGSSCVGARISDVVRNGPAFLAGMRVGDILDSFDGYPVNGRGEVSGAPWAQGQMVSVSELLFRAIEARQYAVTVWRGSRRLQLSMTSAPRKNTMELLFPPFEMPHFISLDGLVLMTSCANLAKRPLSSSLLSMSRSEMSSKRVVVVVHVIRGSRASRYSSLRRGDIVRAISTFPVSTVADIARILRPNMKYVADQPKPKDRVVGITGGGADRTIVFNTTCRQIALAAKEMKSRMQTPSNVMKLA